MKMKYSQNEFTNESLPLNRRQQFKAIFKTEWRMIILIGLMYLVPFALFAVLQILKLSYANFFKTQFYETDLNSYIFYNYLTSLLFSVLSIIPFIIFSILLAGTGKVFQRLIYGEGVLFKNDFLNGIKGNSKQLIVICLIYCLLNFVTVAASGILNFNNGVLNTIFSGLLYGIFYFIFTPILFVSSSISLTYNVNMKSILSNSIKIFSNILLVPLLFALIKFGYEYLLLIPDIRIVILIQSILVVFILPLLILIWQLFMTSIFDKYINIDMYPQIYLKGLRDYNFNGGHL